MDSIIVSKYGGSSTTCYGDVLKKKEITEDDPRRKIIVLSAHGGGKNYNEKDTDSLIKLAKTKDISLIGKIIGRGKKIYPKIADEVFTKLRKNLERRVNQDRLPSGAYEDSIKSFGEYFCAYLTAKTLGYEFVDPRNLFLVTNDFGKAKILPESETMIQKRLSNKKGPFVIPGFYGYTKDGMIATLDRGGSDLTGSYIAAVLGAEEYENFTDKKGVLAANPDIIKNPKVIREMTFGEMSDLAYSGFDIFKKSAIGPLIVGGVPLHVRSTFDYPEKGTYIVSDRVSNPEKPIVGIAYKGGFCGFNIWAFGLNEQMGIEAKILQFFADKKISVEGSPTGIDDIGIIFRKEDLNDEANNVGSIKRELQSLIDESMKIGFYKRAEKSIEFYDGLGNLVISGKGLKGNRGISAKIQSTLDHAGVNIMSIMQGPLERCIIYGIDERDKDKAVNAIYKKYI